MRAALVAVLASIAVVSTASAFTPRVGYSKTLINKRDLIARPNATAPPPLSILDGLNAEVLTEYEISHLVYVNSNQIDLMRQRAREWQVSINVRDDFDLIYVHGIIDARLGLAASLPNEVLDPPYETDAYGLYLIQFIGPLKNDWVHEVEDLGVVVVGYIPYDALLCAGRPSVMRAVATLPAIQFTTQWHRFFKAIEAKPYVTYDLQIETAITPDTPAAIERIRAASFGGVTSTKLTDTELRIGGKFRGEYLETVIREPLVIQIFEAPVIAPSGGVPPQPSPANIPLLQPLALLLLLLAACGIGWARLR